MNLINVEERIRQQLPKNKTLSPMTCHDEGEVRIPEIHLNSPAFNHCGRSRADRLPSAGRSDTTKYTSKNPTLLGESYVCGSICTDLI